MQRQDTFLSPRHPEGHRGQPSLLLHSHDGPFPGRKSAWRVKLPTVLHLQWRTIAGVTSRTSCRQLFKEHNILTLASLYILEVTCFVRQHWQSLDLNSDVRNYNTWKKRDVHVQSCKTNAYKKSVINMGTKIYNKLPDHIKGKDSYKTFKKELRAFLLHHTFYSVK